ncbi:MAG: tetratricopeptide repeat protein [Polyangiales bacterium]
MAQLSLRAYAAGALIALVIPSAASAQTMDTASRAVVDAEARANALEQNMPRVQAATTRASTPYTERFADGELLFQLRDYSRAAVLFTDLVTNYRDTPAFANSLYLLGESLYQAGDRHGARSRFRELVMEHGTDPLFRPFVQRALGRLIEIALRGRDQSPRTVQEMNEIFARLNQLPPGDIEAQTTYVRGKYYFLRPNPDYDLARQAFESIPTAAAIYPQARYFLGAILTAQERFPEAIQAFTRITQLDAQNDQQRQQVIDLAWLAIGRLHLERNEYDGAVEAYQRVGRNSSFFDRALFELAWSHIRNGDAIRAEQALEVLSVSNPDSPLIPEGKLLWGNLLLRTGRFERAQRVFQEVRTQFGPVSARLDQLVAQNTDPQLYFQQLLQMNTMVFDASALLPPQAVHFVREEGTLEDSLGVVSDLNTCRQYIRESEDLIARLNARINSPSRANVFRELRDAREQTFQVYNRITQARAALAAALDQAGSGLNDGNLQGVITQRRSLDTSAARLPIDDAGVRRRDRAAENEFAAFGQEIQRNEQRVSNLEAMLAAMRRYIRDNPNPRGNVDLTALNTEIAQHDAAIASYRARLSDLRRLISAGRAQVGVGDPRYQRDIEIAREYRDLLVRQMDLLRNAGRLPAEAASLFGRLDDAERRAQSFDQRVQAVVDQRITSVRNQVQEEERNVAGYRLRLADLERESADVVGRAVMQSISNVRLHFYRIVMRADLGLVDVAWEERENHNNRARILAEELNRESTALNDEFSEVIEGAENENSQQRPGQTPGGSTTPQSQPQPTPGTQPQPGGSGAPTPEGASNTTPQTNAGASASAGVR